MTRRTQRLTALLLAAAMVSACSGRKSDDASGSSTPVPPATASSTTAAGTEPPATVAPSTEAPTTTAAATTTAGPSATTPAATNEVDSVTWATYREVNTLDPIYAFDYPENTVISAMCESLLRQQPDGTIVPGLATLTRPNDKTMVFTLRPGVKFWDGTPVTADDVVFSLKRESDPSVGGFYGAAFTRVTNVAATAPGVVTITLSQPDYWLDGELASMGGIVLSKSYVTKQGANYGTPKGGVMCTGAFKFAAWKVGDRVTVSRNDAYWNGPAKVRTINFVGVPDENTLTSGLLSGDIGGSYIGTVSAMDRLKSDPSLTVTNGPSFASGALAISNLKGTLADVRVRKALSMAIDRQGVISTLFHGNATTPRAIANQGTYGYAPEVFSAAWNALPEPAHDVAGAKALVQAAGATGKPLVLATSNEIASVGTMTNAVKAAAEDIGLKVELRAVSAANYINLFVDPNARKGIDGFVTVNYPDFADPAALYATFVLPEGTQNFGGYANPQVTADLEQARATADPAARAQLVTKAQAVIQNDLPWIGIANPDTVLVTSAKLTGAPASFVFMSAPWAATLGGAG